MTKVVILLITLLAYSPIFGQRKVGKDPVNINSCQGAINIFDDGDFDLIPSRTSGWFIFPQLNNLYWENINGSFFIKDDGELNYSAGKDVEEMQIVLEDAVGELLEDISEV